MVGVASAIAYSFIYRQERVGPTDIDIDSPFSLLLAVFFATVYVAILLMAVFAEDLLGQIGLYLTAFLGGLVSSVSVSVSAATVLNEGTVGVEVAAGMVVLPTTEPHLEDRPDSAHQPLHHVVGDTPHGGDRGHRCGGLSPHLSDIVVVGMP